MVKSLRALNDELPGDIKDLEHTKSTQLHQLQVQQHLLQQQQQAASSSLSSFPKYFLSTSAQTDGNKKKKDNKRVRTEKSLALQRQMNEDFGTPSFLSLSFVSLLFLFIFAWLFCLLFWLFTILLSDVLQFMQQSLHWVPRIFTEDEILLHWDFYKVHISMKKDEVVKTGFSLINPSQRLNDVSFYFTTHTFVFIIVFDDYKFHVSIMKNAQIEELLGALKSRSDLVPVLQNVFQRLHRSRLVFNSVKRLASLYPVKTDIILLSLFFFHLFILHPFFIICIFNMFIFDGFEEKFIRHKPTSESVGVLEVQFSDHRQTTKFGVVFELTCAYPFSELAVFPRTPSFGNVTEGGITKVIESIEPGYERLERACAALLDLAVSGKDPL